MQTPRVALDQHGLFSRRQARGNGISDGSLNRAVRAGTLFSPVPGLFTTEAAPSDRRAEHLLRTRATILALGNGWHASRRTAAVLHGLPLLGRGPTEVQLTRDRPTPAARSDSRHRRLNRLTESERDVIDDIPTTTLARTVYDLARAESFRAAVVATDRALRAGLPRAELMALLRLHPRWPGSARARRAFTFADGRAESPLESLARASCLEEDLPIFEPQVEVWVHGRLIARVDGLWRERLVVFEGDGASKFEGDGVLPALLTRQERLREAGLPVVRGFWVDLTRRRRQWAAGVRRELADNPGRLRPGVELRSTVVRPTPLDRSDHYLWPPLPSPGLTARRADPREHPSGRRVA